MYPRTSLARRSLWKKASSLAASSLATSGRPLGGVGDLLRDRLRSSEISLVKSGRSSLGILDDLDLLLATGSIAEPKTRAAGSVGEPGSSAGSVGEFGAAIPCGSRLVTTATGWPVAMAATFSAALRLK